MYMNIGMYNEMNSPDNDALLCPRCGYNYLHHERIIVYNRNQDEEETEIITIAESAVTNKVPSADAKNPSLRRHGLTITFTCEGCSDNLSEDFELHIAQHKGNTYIGWGEFKPKTTPEPEDDYELF